MNWTYLVSLKSFFYRIITWLLLLFRKKVFLVIATYWTFSNTLKGFLGLLNGSTTRNELTTVLVSESYNKFLGAAPKILQGLKALRELQLVEGLVLVWTGMAAVIMLLYIWKFFREKGQNYKVDGLEYLLILVIWLLVTSQVHGQSLILSVLNEFYGLLEGLTEFLPSQELNNTNTSNTIVNNSTG